MFKGLSSLLFLYYTFFTLLLGLACDAHALSSAFKTDPKHYGETILKVVDQIPLTVTRTAQIGVLENKRHIKERIKMIASFHRQSRVQTFAIALCVGLAAVLLTEGQLPEEDKQIESIQLSKHHDHPTPQFDSGGFYATNDQAWTWSHSPKGKQEFLGVPFQIEGIIRLASQEAARDNRHNRKEVTGIPVGKVYERLYLLHATHYTSPEGSRVASLRLNYADDSHADIDILYGVHVRDWWRHKYESPINLTDPESRVVWTGHDEQLATYGKSLRLCLTSLLNPQPKKRIETIDLISANQHASEVVFGISGGSANLPEPWRASPKVLEPEVDRSQSIAFKASDRNTGNPIENLHLRVEGADLDSHFFVGRFFTNKDGSVSIEYPPGPLIYLTIWADADGYPPMIIQWDTRHHGPFPESYNYSISAGTEIGGTVKNKEGEPISRAEIRLQGPRISIDSGEKQLLAMTKAHTFSDENGDWSYAGIPDDLEKFRIAFGHPGYRQTIASINSRSSSIRMDFGPNSNHLQVPTFANLEKKQFEVQLQRAPTLEGTVSNPEGEIVPLARVTVGGGRPGRTAITDINGKFSIPNVIFTGRNSLIVETPGFKPWLEPLPAPVESAKRVLAPGFIQQKPPLLIPITVKLETTVPFKGQVISKEGNAVPNVQVTIGSWREQRIIGWETLTDEEGMFVWNGAPADSFTLHLKHPEYLTKSTVVSQMHLNTKMITLQPALVLIGKVVNARTRQPVAHARLKTGYRASGNDGIKWDEKPQAIALQGEYKIKITRGAEFERFLRVEAQGYKTAISNGHREEGTYTQDFQLEAIHLP
jgi:hypothetical protein